MRCASKTCAGGPDRPAYASLLACSIMVLCMHMFEVMNACADFVWSFATGSNTASPIWLARCHTSLGSSSGSAALKSFGANTLRYNLKLPSCCCLTVAPTALEIARLCFAQLQGYAHAQCISGRIIICQSWPAGSRVHTYSLLRY